MKRLALIILGLTLLVSSSAYARVINVPDDAQTIRDAIGAAAQDAVDTVLLADNTYTGDGNVNVVVDVAVVIMSANGPTNCIIDCENADASQALILHQPGALIGVTITRATQSGIRIENVNPYHMDHCRFVENHGAVANQSGGGVHFRSSTGTIRDCIFDSNTNIGSGGGLFFISSTATVTNCIFTNNHADRFGGGVHITSSSNITLWDCIVAHNSSSSDGGGVSHSITSQSTISFCTIVENEAQGDASLGGGLYKGSNSNPTVINSIFWGNTAGGGGNQLEQQNNGTGAGGAITISYCDVQDSVDEAGGWDGDNILNEAPQFVEGRDPFWGVNGYYLDPESPCVDAGSDSAAALGVDTMFTRADRRGDEDQADIGYHYGPSSFRIVGRLFGQVLSLTDDSPVGGALVRTQHGFTAITDDNGAWEIRNAFAEIPFRITASKIGFNPQTLEDQNVQEDGELEIVFRLPHPEFSLNPGELVGEVNVGDTAEVDFDVINNGNGPLTWNSSTKLLDQFDLQPWVRRQSLAVGDSLHDSFLYGVAFDGEHYYVSGANGADPNQIYVLDTDGSEVRRFAQFGAAHNGMRDLAWDGELLWGASDRDIIGFTTDGDSVTSFSGPVDPTVAITYDPQHELYWMAGTTSSLYSYDRAGNRISFLGRGVMRIYGLAYRADDPDTCNLYVHCTTADEARPCIYKVNTTTGDIRLVTILDPAEGGIPEGAEITTLLDPYSIAMLTMENNAAEDRIDIYQVASRSGWMQLSQAQGEVAGGEHQQMTLTLLADGFDEGVYEAEAIFRHNAASAADTIPITMEVTQGPVHAARMVNTAFGWNLVSVSLQPDEQDIAQIVRPLADAGLLIFVKDCQGRYYDPIHHFDNLVPWDAAQAYWFKMRGPGQLSIPGTTVRSDDPIDLQAGWQGVSYYPRAAMNAAQALAGIAGQLTIAKDDQGGFYSPHWQFNSIGRCQSGKGYMLKTSEAVQLVWGAGGRAAAVPPQWIAQRPSFLPELPSTGNDMSLLLLTDGTFTGEVGVKAGERLVGSAVFYDGEAGVSIREDDPLTAEIEGAREGDPLEILLLDAAGKTLPAKFQTLEGEAAYTTNGFAVLHVIAELQPKTPFLADAFPNPFNARLNISFQLPESGPVKVLLYDASGRIAGTIWEGNVSAGVHKLTYDGANLSTGIYLLRFEAAGVTQTRKLILMK